MTQVVFIENFIDEVAPCEASLEGWAEWLSQPCPEWGRDTAAVDGAVFKAHVLELGEDIVARRSSEAPMGWALSREPGDEEFVAVRFAEGLGWSAENIVERGVDIGVDTINFTNSMAEALREWLSENDADCDDTEFVAAGVMSSGWIVQYRAQPAPHCVLARAS